MKLLIETREGWHICGEANDGHEAVAKTLELKPDLVVLASSRPKQPLSIRQIKEEPPDVA
jgi:AmiR/NasT family two-component response regulator